MLNRIVCAVIAAASLLTCASCANNSTTSTPDPTIAPTNTPIVTETPTPTLEPVCAQLGKGEYIFDESGNKALTTIIRDENGIVELSVLLSCDDATDVQFWKYVASAVTIKEFVGANIHSIMVMGGNTVDRFTALKYERKNGIFELSTLKTAPAGVSVFLEINDDNTQNELRSHAQGIYNCIEDDFIALEFDESPTPIATNTPTPTAENEKTQLGSSYYTFEAPNGQNNAIISFSADKDHKVSCSIWLLFDGTRKESEAIYTAAAYLFLHAMLNFESVELHDFLLIGSLSDGESINVYYSVPDEQYVFQTLPDEVKETILQLDNNSETSERISAIIVDMANSIEWKTN